MIDVSSKLSTLRYARAEGKFYCQPETLDAVRKGRVPKGDVLEVARSIGIAAAKRVSDWVVFCHPIPLDWIEVSISVESDHIHVCSEVKAIWKTGVEMEALTAVMAALLNIYDMLKPLDDRLRMGDIQLVHKEGGKGDDIDSSERSLRAAILVISDSIYHGRGEDQSGQVIRKFLQDLPVMVVIYEIWPDDQEKIIRRLKELADHEGMDLILTTGGTGLGPKDVTPEATLAVIEREVPGIAEAIRHYGQERTPYAMLSREICGVRGTSLIINLPGSSRAAKESMEALFHGLLHAFPMLRGKGHH